MSESFGHQVKRHRLAADMLIGGVAHSAGITPAYLGLIEADCANPSLVLQGKLIRAINCVFVLDSSTQMPPDSQKDRKALKREHLAKLKRKKRERKKK